MTEEQKQEQISRFFVGAIVAHAGHVFQFGAYDLGGVDASIRLMTFYQREKGKRILTSGNVVDVQLKCTTEKGVSRRKNSNGNGILIYDLEEKNYNDLIVRKKLRESSLASSLLLILVVLPEDKARWFSMVDNERQVKSLSLGGSAYWYYPEDELTVTKNLHKKRIVIPEENALNLDFIEKLRLQKMIV